MINDLIKTLVNYAIKNDLITLDDEVYCINRLLRFLKLDSYTDGEILELNFDNLIEEFINYAVENELIKDTQNSKDQFDTELMNIFLDKPSNVIRKFNYYYNINKKSATDYFYNLSVKSNYVRSGRIKKDIRFKKMTEYGELDITINMSKPEKDPRDIAAALEKKSITYPKCQLCIENEGYEGRIDHPARANIRLIPLKLNNHDFYLQYSPYAYYNEHCIILDKNHVPMVINHDTFNSLIDFVTMFPHYMIGSNADLPIVGGSILTHNHFQGGNYNFPIFNTKAIMEKQIGNVKLEILKWPLSTIRLTTKNKNDLVNMADKILDKWINYSDLDNDIISYTNDIRHNTITPILRMVDNNYEMYLILRNNRTTVQYPMGLFHPHPEYHNIKKENIGLIEAIGLAILPSRLKKEISLMVDAILNKKDYHEDTNLIKHANWLDKMENKEQLNKDNIQTELYNYIGETFKCILENAGVFKQDEKGLKGFKKFIELL